MNGRKNKTKLKVVLLAMAIVAIAPAQDRGPMSLPGVMPTSVIQARTACRKGDIVTILINEQSAGSFAATTNATKKDSTAVDKANLPLVDVFTGPILGQILGKAKSLPQKIVGALTGASSTAANSTVSGAGTTTTNGKYTATVSVTVKEVLPNGNLVLEGQRWITVNKEKQNIVFSGVVRRDDVSIDNTVPSEKVADARIEATGKGVIADRQRRGILTRILEWAF